MGSDCMQSDEQNEEIHKLGSHTFAGKAVVVIGGARRALNACLDVL
jgi:hypothetical protein